MVMFRTKILAGWFLFVPGHMGVICHMGFSSWQTSSSEWKKKRLRTSVCADISKHALKNQYDSLFGGENHITDFWDDNFFCGSNLAPENCFLD